MATPIIAVIGTGHIGRALALNLTKGNRPVLVAAREQAKAQELATEAGPLARAVPIAEAVKTAEIVILAIWFSSIREFLAMYADDLAGKILVDPSNPIAPDGKGGFVKVVGETESAGEINASFLPTGARLAKAPGTLGAATLVAASGQTPDPAVLFYATDDRAIDPAVEELIRDTGFEPVRVGGLNQSIRIGVFGDLHEFGALGKTVTKTEVAR